MSLRSFFDNIFGEKQTEVVEASLSWQDLTPNYRKRFYDVTDFLINELPIFTIWTARAMMYDPVVKIGLSVRNAILSAAQVRIETENEQVREYVQKLHAKMWGQFGHIIRRTKQWGFQGAQLFYDVDESDGRPYPCAIKTYMPHDVRCLAYRGVPMAFKVNAYGIPSQQKLPLFPPRGLWVTFNTEYNDFYGESILRGAYPPWFEKWMKHGAKRTSQLRFMKDASRGDTISYPPRARYPLQNGQTISAADVVREITEHTMSGATIRLPSTRDELGNPEWEYKPPVDTGNPTGIIQWGQNLDVDIWRGLGVPEEVIRASEGGSGFSGRSVPFLICLSNCNDEHVEYISCLKRSVYEPLVRHVFGTSVEFDVMAVPLAQTFVEDIAGSSVGGASMGGAHGDRRYPEATDTRTGMDGTREITQGPLDKGTSANGGPGASRLNQSRSPHNKKSKAVKPSRKE
jgi:hypothetical protein